MFVVGKILGMLTSVGTLLLLACVVGLILTRRRDSVWGRRFLRLGIGGFVVALLLPVDQWALLPLEDRFPPVVQPPAHVDGIIVLGGAVLRNLSEARGIPSMNDAAERMTEGVALARRYPGAKLVFTGGEGTLVHGRTTEADVARTLFLSLGVPEDRLVIEDVSRTTWENAVLTKALVKPAPGETWILLTSAFHMPRSVGVFRKVGWDVVPWPVGYKSGWSFLLWLPEGLAQHLYQLDEATHEYVGLVAYRLTGRSAELLPGPAN